MKLSDLSTDDIQLVQPAQAETPLKLSNLHPDDIKAVAPEGFFEREGRNVVDKLPLIGGVVGGVLGTPADVVAGPMGNVAGAAAGGYVGTAAKNLINSYIDPDKAPHTTAQAIGQPFMGGIQQGGMQAGGELLGAVAAPVLSKMASPVSDYLAKLAEKKAIAATGATGPQAAKFAPGAGRQLLDRGIVGFGNSQAQIAGKAGQALDQSGQGISDTLGQLDKQGVTVDRNTVLDYLRKKIADLSGNEGEKGLVKQLQSKVSDIEEQIPGSATDVGAENAADTELSSHIPIGKSEEIKRSFADRGKFGSNSDADALSANRLTSGAYRQASEDAASAANPDLASQFKADKDTYSLLSPVAEAAEKRASTAAQSPPGGFLDSMSSAAGAVAGGTPGALLAPIARRAIAPRISASIAAGADWLSSILQSTPAVLGKYAGPLMQAAERDKKTGSGISTAATDYILQSTDPNYQRTLQSLKSDPQEQR